MARFFYVAGLSVSGRLSWCVDMWETIGKALCLVLVIEGMLPFLYPARWRRMVISLATTSDKQLRTVGLISMLIGAGLLYLLS